MIRFHNAMSAVALVASGAFVAGTADANTQTLSLTRTNLNNVSDVAGLYQHETGTLANSAGGSIGTYIVVRRVSTGGGETYNVADEKMTLFFSPSSTSATGVPEVIVLEGVYSYNNGDFFGSVSAASGRYHYLVGSEGTGTVATSPVTKLVFQYLGTNPF